MSRLRVDANYFNIFVITVLYSEIYPCPIRNCKITWLQYLVDSQSLGSSAGTKSGKGVIGSGLRVPRPAGRWAAAGRQGAPGPRDRLPLTPSLSELGLSPGVSIRGVSTASAHQVEELLGADVNP